MTTTGFKRTILLPAGVLAALTQIDCVSAITNAPSSNAIPFGTNHVDVHCGTNVITVLRWIFPGRNPASLPLPVSAAPTS